MIESLHVHRSSSWSKRAEYGIWSFAGEVVRLYCGANNENTHNYNEINKTTTTTNGSKQEQYHTLRESSALPRYCIPYSMMPRTVDSFCEKI